MMKGATDEQRKEWKMSRGQRFSWLQNLERTVEGPSFLVYFSDISASAFPSMPFLNSHK